MSMSVKIDDFLYEQARVDAHIQHRTIDGQIEYWATVGRAALDNPDLPVSFVVEALASMREPREHSTQFIPRTLCTKSTILADMQSKETVFDRAESVFGSADLACTWMTSHNIVLGASPSSMVNTEAGVNEVLKLLSAIASGGTV